MRSKLSRFDIEARYFSTEMALLRSEIEYRLAKLGMTVTDGEDERISKALGALRSVFLDAVSARIKEAESGD